jgi:outer membrane phospholipase A
MRIPLLLLAGSLAFAAENEGRAELIQSIFPYEPSYFAIDPGWRGRDLNAKFQVSFAFRLLKAEGYAEPGPLKPAGLYGAYSQTSFWDLEAHSSPFFDSSYRPEIWWHTNLPGAGIFDHVGLEPGIAHESNGRSDPDSRSMNMLTLRAIGAWKIDGWDLIAKPRGRMYVEKEDNPDIQRYRGYVDLDASLEKEGSWGLRALGRIGSRWDKGSIQLELTHPLAPWTNGVVDGLAYLQVFNGWSETLLDYNQRTPDPRILLGFAITR